MSDSEELARKERRRRLIERLNAHEEQLGPERSEPDQMSEEELEVEIEKERIKNYTRGMFPWWP